jgi:hypothetical protein
LEPDPGSRIRIPLWLVIAADIGARLFFLFWTDPRAISPDLYGWKRVAAELAAGSNPYNTTALLNWPPLWMQVLFFAGRASSGTGIDVVRIVQALLITAEVGLLLVTDRLMAALGIHRRRLLLLVGIALNPICILLICQHGNFDVLVALAVSISLLWLFRFLRGLDAVPWLVAALFIGLGVALKSAPIVLAPLLCAGVRRVPTVTRAFGGTLVFGPALYGLSVIFVLGPQQIVRHVLAYRSIPDWFGVTGLFHWMGRDDWTRVYAVVFPVGLGAAMTLLAISLWKARAVSPEEILLWALLLLAAIPFLGCGYGPQYLYWFWPLFLAAAATGSPAFRKAAGAFAAIAATTYVAEYALIERLGGFLLYPRPSAPVQLVAFLLRSNRVTALANTPLFFAYGILFAAAARDLARRHRRRRMAPEPEP